MKDGSELYCTHEGQEMMTKSARYRWNIEFLYKEL